MSKPREVVAEIASVAQRVSVGVIAAAAVVEASADVPDAVHYGAAVAVIVATALDRAMQAAVSSKS